MTPPLVNASGENWVGFNQSGLPLASLIGLGLAYDARDNYTVLFGACPTGSASPCNQTWVFRQGNWSQLHPVSSPPRVYEVAMAYDPQSQSVIMFGGGGASPVPVINQTWEFSGGNWSKLNASGAPSPRYGASMAFDAAEGYLLLFGGSDRTGNPVNETWSFENATWTNRTVGVAPPEATGMTYDPLLRAVVAYCGGNIGDNCTWTFQNGSWKNVTPIHSPAAQRYASLSYDPLSQSAILFGGLGSGNQTWAFNGTAWVRLRPLSAPSSRAGAAMTYDARDALTLLVGGGSGTDSETWAFGAGKVAFSSVPGLGGSTRMGGLLHANGTAAWLPFNSYALREAPNPGYSGLGLNVSGSLVLLNGSYLLFGNATVRSDFFTFPTLTLESLPPGCVVDFNGTQYANGSSPSFAAPGTFSLSAPSCGTVAFGFWTARGNASIANATNSTTRITLTGPATVVAHFLANIAFFAQPAGAGGILVNGTRVPSAATTPLPVGTYLIQGLAAPGWRLASLTTRGSGVSISNGLLSIVNSGSVFANFSAYPTVVIGTNDPTCGPVSFAGVSEPNGSLVGTDLGSFPLAAP
ncbi:MAG: hypothetical protein L3K18_02810, partial [Thermoplasmata archaeon]|nr:hypothetical protein [Thermoplasmata archaeon]